MYLEFVKKVSLERKKQVDNIELIVQGHVWYGVSGNQKGLVDVLGRSETGINVTVEL